MKYLIVLLIAIGCSSVPKCPPVIPCPVAEVKTDTVKVIIIRNDSLQAKVDSLSTLLYLNTYKVERVKYYVKIVDRNPSQIKFLKGWIRRAVE